MNNQTKTFFGAGIGIIIIVVVVLLSRGHEASAPVVVDDTTSTSETGATTTSTGTDMESTDDNTHVRADGLAITIVKAGTGAAAKNGDQVTVNYTGKFTNGTSFDSNVDPAFKHVEPFTFVLGGGMVIKGWDDGVLGMQVGEKRHISVPSGLGYGPNDYGPIPGGSTLEFDVELVSIHHS